MIREPQVVETLALCQGCLATNHWLKRSERETQPLVRVIYSVGGRVLCQPCMDKVRCSDCGETFLLGNDPLDGRDCPTCRREKARS